MKRWAIALALATALLAVPVVLRGQAAQADEGHQEQEVRPYQELRGQVREPQPASWLSTPDIEAVYVDSEAFVYVTPALAHDAWKQKVSVYERSSIHEDAGRPTVGKEARSYSSDLIYLFGYFVIWRSENVVGRLFVSKSSDVEFDGLRYGYVIQLARIQQGNIARATP